MKLRIFRILTVFFSIVLFAAGIMSALSIFLPLTGYNRSTSLLFIFGYSVFSTYHFSAFMIPLLFLYAAVRLLLPGWSRESGFILLGFPLYFITTVAGEQIIYRLLLLSNIPLIKQFVTVSALICILLLLCLEVFLMIIFAGKVSLMISAAYSRDVINDTYEDDIIAVYDEDETEELIEEESEDSDASESGYSETADTVNENEQTETLTVKIDDIVQDEAPTASEEDVSSFLEAYGTIEEYRIPDAHVFDDEEDTSSLTIEEPVKAEAEAVSGECNSDDDPCANGKIHEANSVTDELSAVETVEPAESAEVERILPHFNPSDPNNLFDDLDEITADVKRISRNYDGYGDAEKDESTGSSNEAAGGVEAVDSGTDSYAETAGDGQDTVQAESPDTGVEPVLEEQREMQPLAPAVETITSAGQTEEAVSADLQDSEIVQPPRQPAEQEQRGATPPAETSPAVAAAAGIQVPEQTPPQISSEETSPAAFETDISSAAPVPQNMGELEHIPSAADAPAAAKPAHAAAEPAGTVPAVAEAAASLAAQQPAEIPQKQQPAASASSAEPPLEYMPVPNKVSDLIDSLVVIDGTEPAAVHSAVDEDRSYDDETFDDEDDETFDDDDSEYEEDDDKTVDELFVDKPPAETPLKPVPVLARKKYAIPFDLLTNYPDGEYWIVDDATRRAAMMLKSTFNEFKIDVSITGIRKGPVVTMFEMLPSPGIKLSKITNLQDNIALRLAASHVRIVAPIPGKHAVGIEVPNKKRAIVSFRELIEADLPESAKMAIPVVLGKDVTGNPQILDLAQTPHLLIAGATGSGKSVCVNSIILSILYNRRPDEVKLILVDPKIVELKLYNDIAHLLSPVITEPKRAFQALQYCLCEMERRYALLDNMGVRDIKTFNARIKADKIAMEPLPYIVIIIDEFADLMATSGKELEATVSRLCAMSRAVGIHLVLATQRPSIDVITGLIKANIPSRIAFMVASKTDSRIILDEGGAEKLLGKGDMLFISAATPFPTRMQGAFVSEQEVERVVACVKDYCEPEYIDDEIFVDDDDDTYDSALYSDNNDPLYDQALEIVTFAGKASASYVQRKLKIGYNRAARLIEEMEARGIVGPPNGSKPREILRR